MTILLWFVLVDGQLFVRDMLILKHNVGLAERAAFEVL